MFCTTAVRTLKFAELEWAKEWCAREQETRTWTSQWSKHSSQFREMNLVGEVADERVLATRCNICDPPDLEAVSDSESEPEELIDSDIEGSSDCPDSLEEESEAE